MGRPSAHAERDAAIFARSNAVPAPTLIELAQEFGLGRSRVRSIIVREQRRVLNRRLPLSDFRHPDHPLQKTPAAHRALWAHFGIRHDEELLAKVRGYSLAELRRNLIVEPNVGLTTARQIMDHITNLRRQANEEG